MNPAPPPSGRGVTLALGGGAALGFAHIGVLRVLAEAGVRVAAAAGTSMGALAAACLAADRLDALEEIARGATRRRIFGYLDPHLARGALLGGRRIARELAGHFGPVRFEDLAIPAAAICADLTTAEEVRLTRGPVIEAVTASMALPGLFRPVALGGRRLIDGGMVTNIPVGAARALAPGLPVVAVDVMGDYDGHAAGLGTGLPPALATLRAGFLIMMVQLQRRSLALDPPEVLIQPRVGHLHTGAFGRAAELITLGRHAAEAALPAIRAATAA